MLIGLVSFQFFSFFTDMPGRDISVGHPDDPKGNILKDISREYVTKDATEKLASELWDGHTPGGGSGFISNRCSNGKPVDWSKMAYEVLHTWADYNRQGRVLLAVLEKTNPTVASKFKWQLLHDEGEKIVLICVQI